MHRYKLISYLIKMTPTHKTVYSLFVIVTFLLISCGKENTTKADNNIIGELVQETDKVFTLDNETSFDHLQGKLHTVNDTLYYSFFNRENHSIYIHDFNSGHLHKKIVLEKEGPNGVPAPNWFLEYYFIDWDNILVNNLEAYFMVNHKGEVLNKSLISEGTSFFNKETIAFDETTYVIDNMLFCGLQRILAKEGEASYKRAIFQLDTLKVIKKSIDERDFVIEYNDILAKNTANAKLGGLDNFTTQLAQVNKQLYGTYAINDSLFLFENEKYVNSFYAGNPKVKVASLDAFLDNTIVERFTSSTGNGGVSVYPNPTQAPTYANIFSDPNGRYIYRIMKEGSTPEYNDNLQKEVPKLIGLSLIVFDTETKQSQAFDLPHEHIKVYGAFVSSSGIYFPYKEQAREDQKVYAVFKIK